MEGNLCGGNEEQKETIVEENVQWDVQKETYRRKGYKRNEVEKEIHVRKGSICRRKYACMEASTETKEKAENK